MWSSSTTKCSIKDEFVLFLCNEQTYIRNVLVHKIFVVKEVQCLFFFITFHSPLWFSEFIKLLYNIHCRRNLDSFFQLHWNFIFHNLFARCWSFGRVRLLWKIFGWKCSKFQYWFFGSSLYVVFVKMSATDICFAIFNPFFKYGFISITV